MWNFSLPKLEVLIKQHIGELFDLKAQYTLDTNGNPAHFTDTEIKQQEPETKQDTYNELNIA